MNTAFPDKNILFINNPVPMFIYDIETLEILQVNKAAMQHYGYPKKEFLSLTIRDLRPPEQTPDLLDTVAKGRNFSGNVCTWEHKKKNGEIFLAEVLVQPFEHEGREVKMVQVREISSDLDRKEFLASLQKELTYHLNNSPLGIFESDADYKIKHITERITQITGYTSDDLIGRKLTELAEEFVIKDDLEKVLQVIQKIESGEIKREKQELRIQTKDGDVKSTRWFISVLRDRNNKLVSIFSLVEDLTDQKNIERSRNRAISMIESTPDLVGMVDTEGKVFYLNSSGIKLLKLKDTIDKYSITDFHPTEETKRLKETIFPYVRKNGTWSGDLSFKSPITGAIIPTSSVIICHRDERGIVEYYSTTSRNITEQLNNRREIIGQKNRLSLAIEAGQIGFWNYYLKEEKLDFDKKWVSEILGYGGKKLSHDPDFWKNMIHPDDLPRVAKSFTNFIEGDKEYYASEHRMKKEDGSWTWVYSRAIMVEGDGQENPAYVSGIHIDINDRKQSEQKLRRNRDRLQTALNIDTVGVIFWEGEGTIKEVNDTFLEMSGFNQEEIIGKSWRYFTPDEFYPESEKALADINKTGRTKPFEKQYIRKDGSRWWGLFAPRRINENEAVEYVIDISNRKELEQQLKAEKDFVRTTIESLPGLFYMIDEDENYVLWNENLEKTFYQGRDEVQKLRLVDFCKEQDQKRISDSIQQAFETGQSEIEIDMIDKNGQLVRQYLTHRKFVSEGDIYVIGSGIDITERVEAERQLRLHDTLLTQLFENSPICIVQLDKEGQIIRVNESFEKTFQYNRNDVKGANLNDLIVPEGLKLDQEEVINHQNKTSKDALQFESKRIKKDGTEVPVLIGSVPVYIDSELVTNYIIYVDITERKAYEKHLKEVLKEKQILLQEVHHRVKNNLAVISGLLQLESFSTDNLELQKGLSESQRRIKTMALIHEKLYQSQNLSNIPFNEYVQDLGISIYKDLDPQNNIVFEAECDSFNLNVNQAIPCALIINELLSNAYDHGVKDKDDGQVLVSVKKENETVSISVKDNGVGFPSDFDSRNASSMGFTIISTLINQLKADLHIKNNKGAFISFQFTKGGVKGSSSMLSDSY
ncbi:MAG: PAS domain S-box protein [Gracilimonas sp.]